MLVDFTLKVDTIKSNGVKSGERGKNLLIQSIVRDTFGSNKDARAVQNAAAHCLAETFNSFPFVISSKKNMSTRQSQKL